MSGNFMDKRQNKPIPRATMDAIIREVYEPVLRQQIFSYSALIAELDKRTAEQKAAAQAEYLKWCHAYQDLTGDFEANCSLEVNHKGDHKDTSNPDVTITWRQK